MIKIKGITVEPKLEKFLRKEKVYTKFCANVNNPEENNKKEAPMEIESIGYSFLWAMTPEGADFWFELCDTFESQQPEL